MAGDDRQKCRKCMSNFRSAMGSGWSQVVQNLSLRNSPEIDSLFLRFLRIFQGSSMTGSRIFIFRLFLSEIFLKKIQNKKGLIRRLTLNVGRGREIRTPDILLPKQARYQTALYPVNLCLAMTYSHMGRPHTTIGDASFHC